jgi:hypothetical protein
MRLALREGARVFNDRLPAREAVEQGFDAAVWSYAEVRVFTRAALRIQRQYERRTLEGRK